MPHGMSYAVHCDEYRGGIYNAIQGIFLVSLPISNVLIITCLGADECDEKTKNAYSYIRIMYLALPRLLYHALAVQHPYKTKACQIRLLFFVLVHLWRVVEQSVEMQFVECGQFQLLRSDFHPRLSDLSALQDRRIGTSLVWEGWNSDLIIGCPPKVTV